MTRPTRKKSGTWIGGTVIRGDGRGKDLGFPTANLQLDIPSQRPAPGIYAVQARILPDPTTYNAVLHVGPRPTFEDTQPTVEVYLIDFPDQSLYGRALLFQCVTRIRGIKKFATPASLIAAMKEDVQKSLEILRR